MTITDVQRARAQVLLDGMAGKIMNFQAEAAQQTDIRLSAITAVQWAVGVDANEAISLLDEYLAATRPVGGAGE